MRVGRKIDGVIADVAVQAGFNRRVHAVVGADDADVFAERLPEARAGVVDFSGRIGIHVICNIRHKLQPVLPGGRNHPGQCNVGELRFVAGVAAADIAVHTGEPHLRNARVFLEAQDRKIAPLLVNRHRVIGRLDARVKGGVLPVRIQRRFDRVPDAQHVDADIEEVAGFLEFFCGLAVLAVITIPGGLAVALGGRHPAVVEQLGKRARGIRAAAEPENEQPVVEPLIGVAALQKAVSAQNPLVDSRTESSAENFFFAFNAHAFFVVDIFHI